MIPFEPENRLNMVGWMAANSDPEGYGELVAFTLPAGRDVDGPSLVFSRINSDQAFSSARTLLGSGGSEVQFGDLLTIPIEDSILYVLPMYVRAKQEAAVPELKLVMVVNGTNVAVANNLPEAIEDATGAVSGEGPRAARTVAAARSISRSSSCWRRPSSTSPPPRKRSAAGDLATYQSEQEQAQALVEQANELLAGETGGGRRRRRPSPTP